MRWPTDAHRPGRHTEQMHLLHDPSPSPPARPAAMAWPGQVMRSLVRVVQRFGGHTTEAPCAFVDTQAMWKDIEMAGAPAPPPREVHGR